MTSPLATLGDYERYLRISRRPVFGHLDPRGAGPLEEVISVTVVAPSGVWADALSTAAFVLGEERGAALLESLDGVEGIIVDCVARRLTSRAASSTLFSRFSAMICSFSPM